MRVAATAVVPATSELSNPSRTLSSVARVQIQRRAVAEQDLSTRSCPAVWVLAALHGADACAVPGYQWKSTVPQLRVQSTMSRILRPSAEDRKVPAHQLQVRRSVVDLHTQSCAACGPSIHTELYSCKYSSAVVVHVRTRSTCSIIVVVVHVSTTSSRRIPYLPPPSPPRDVVPPTWRQIKVSCPPPPRRHGGVAAERP